MVIDHLSSLKSELAVDLTIANGENASGGVGLVAHNAKSLFEAGIDVITSGNHIFQHKSYEELFQSSEEIIRPANYPPQVIGKGFLILRRRNLPPVAVINLLGRTFMIEPVDDPFQVVQKIINDLPSDTKIIIVDLHAEATSEKNAMGWYLDGHVSAVIGTHTHVQTSDERILPKGTAYITDVGMVGPINSVIGMDPEAIIKKYITRLPVRFTVAKGPVSLDAVVIEIDDKSGKAVAIKRIQIIDETSRDDLKEEE